MAERNYTLSRARLYFARFTAAETPGPFRYLGNTPEFNLTIEAENLDHVSSDEGVREVDDSVPLDVTRTGTMICDDIQLANLALFFFGEESSVAVVAAAGETQNIMDPSIDEIYVLGLTDADRVGVRNISLTSIGIMGSANLDEDTDFTVDEMNGQIEFLRTPPAGDYIVTYDVTAGTYDRVVSGGTPVSGAMRAIQKNPKGRNHQWVMPKVQLAPNGDLPLKGDEWQQIPFTIQVQKPTTGEALYINGVPV